MSSSNQKSAVIFLCKDIKKQTEDFAKDILKMTNLFDIYLVSDQWNDSFSETGAFMEHTIFLSAGSQIMKCYLSDERCIAENYYGCNINGEETHIKKKVIAYDKMLYFFLAPHPKPYQFIWIFEDDVFIPSVQHLINLHYKYCGYDLVTPNNFRKKDMLPDWHWRHIFSAIEPPYYHSMVCACGMSLKMLNAIKEYWDIHKRFFHIEAMFNTLGMHKGLQVQDAFELKSCVWMGEWGIDEFLLLPDNIFHPIKNIENHNELRNQIQEHKRLNPDYKPVNKLPDFLQ